MDTALQDPLVGRLVDGRYLVQGRVARGGMATVYVALDRRLDREVALKVMHAHLADDESFTARFIREARSAARLSHPNVVQVFDQGEDGEIVYLAMEYLRGRTLRAVLAERGSLSPGEALAVLEPVVDALAAAHRAGIVHRDVKPENVVLTDEGRVKVADFGLARAATAGTSTSGVLMGTVAYLSPELVTRGLADPRSDVYAVGVMLFEMLTGQQPFVGEVPIQVAYRHVHEDVPAPSDLVPALPDGLDALVLATTSREPDERPEDGNHLLEMVRTVRSTLPTQTVDLRPAPGAAAPGAAAPGAQADGRTEVVDLRSVHRPTQALPGLADLERLRDRDAREAARELDGEAPDLVGMARRRRRRGVLALVTLLLLALVLGVGSWWYFAGPLSRVPVPPVAGLTVAEATQRLQGLELAARPEPRFDDRTPRGRLIGTEPAAGQEARRDSTVTLFVSKGPEFVPVPALAGVPEATARTRLARAGLRVGESRRAFDEAVAAGRVVSSTPAQGARARSGSDVALVVSRGPAPVEVPDVRGRTQQEALDLLAEAGLKGDTSAKAFDESPEPVPAGSVLSQGPPPGETLARGGTVELVISEGPPLVVVPDVVRQQAREARRILEGQGFRVEFDELLGAFFGTVRSQDPPAGSRVPRGSTITLLLV